jgi:hypothetical protein
VPMYLDAILVDEPLIGGLAPRLGKAHLRTLTVMGFPSVTYPGILDDLNRLAIPYRWSTRAVALDKTDATRVLTRIRRQWFAKRKSVAAILKEVMTNESSALLDTDAHNKALDADAALQELGSDLIGQAYVSATVTVWDEDARVADERLRLVEKVIQGRDFTCIAETVNAVEAWLGSLPGHVYANVRQPPVSTLNLAHMMPLSAVWAGPERNEHLDGPPLLMTGRSRSPSSFRAPCIAISSPTPKFLRKSMANKSSPSSSCRRCSHGSCRPIEHSSVHGVQRARWAEPGTNKRRLAIAKRRMASQRRARVGGRRDHSNQEQAPLHRYLGAIRRI